MVLVVYNKSVFELVLVSELVLVFEQVLVFVDRLVLVALRLADIPISLVRVAWARRKSNSSRVNCGLRRSISIYFLGPPSVIKMRVTR